jgi:hypothetical protein
MHTINLFSQAIKQYHLPLPFHPILKTCCITGQKTECIPRKYVLSNSFTAQELLKAPDSKFACIDAYQAFKFRGHRSSWFASHTEMGDFYYKKLSRIEMRSVIFDFSHTISHPLTDWAIYASTTGKKHGSFFAPINTGKFPGIIGFDSETIDCSNIDLIRESYYLLTCYLKLGISRSYLLNPDFPVWLINKIGIKAYNDFRYFAMDKYSSNLYKFLVYLLPSQQELKDELKTAKNNV